MHVRPLQRTFRLPPDGGMRRASSDPIGHLQPVCLGRFHSRTDQARPRAAAVLNSNDGVLHSLHEVIQSPCVSKPIRSNQRVQFYLQLALAPKQDLYPPSEPPSVNGYRVKVPQRRNLAQLGGERGSCFTRHSNIPLCLRPELRVADLPWTELAFAPRVDHPQLVSGAEVRSLGDGLRVVRGSRYPSGRNCSLYRGPSCDVTLFGEHRHRPESELTLCSQIPSHHYLLGQFYPGAQ